MLEATLSRASTKPVGSVGSSHRDFHQKVRQADGLVQFPEGLKLSVAQHRCLARPISLHHLTGPRTPFGVAYSVQERYGALSSAIDSRRVRALLEKWSDSLAA